MGYSLALSVCLALSLSLCVLLLAVIALYLSNSVIFAVDRFMLWVADCYYFSIFSIGVRLPRFRELHAQRLDTYGADVAKAEWLLFFGSPRPAKNGNTTGEEQ